MDHANIARVLDAGTTSAGRPYFVMDLVKGMPSFQPDCVVLDVQMPGMSGLQVQEQLSSSGNRLPVIFITAHDEAGVRERALAAGAVAFLRKPFNDELFIETLRVALN